MLAPQSSTQVPLGQLGLKAGEIGSLSRDIFTEHRFIPESSNQATMLPVLVPTMSLKECFPSVRSLYPGPEYASFTTSF